MVTPKDAKTTIQEIKATLHKEIDISTIPNLQCKPTKAGNLVLTLNSDAEAMELKNHLRTNNNLTAKLDVAKVKPRMTKVIIFGVPTANIDDENDTKKEYYKEKILDPALRKTLRMEKVESALHKIMKSNRNDTVNLVVKVPQRDAVYLEQYKLNISFNRCAVRRYIVTPRCFNCQRLGHMSRDCKDKETCAHFHNTADCLSDRKRCVNCYDADRQRTRSERPIDYEHFAYEGCCTAYRKFQRQILDQQRQKASSSG